MPAEKQLKTLTPAQYAFIDWLYKKHPNVARAAEAHHATLNGFMDSLTSVFNNVVTQAPELMKTYVAGKTQIDQLKINLERAKQGLYPLDVGGQVYSGSQSAMPSPAGVPLLVWIAGGALITFLILKR